MHPSPPPWGGEGRRSLLGFAEPGCVHQLAASQAKKERLPRLLAEHRAAADDAGLERGVVALGLVHEAAIVPDHEVARPPAVLVAARQTDYALVKRLDEFPPLVIAHADDALGMIAEEDALASGLGVRAHDRMIDRRHGGALRFGH